MFNDFFNNLSTLELAFWFIAAPSSVVLLFQLILTVVGMDSMGDMETDVNFDSNSDVDMDSDSDSDGHAPFQLLTFRNLVAFFTMAGWSGLAFLDNGFSEVSSIVLAVLVGTFSMFVMAAIVYFLYRMRQEVYPTFKSAVGQNATVYLDIPEKGNGKGKVNVVIDGALKTVDAYSVAKNFVYGEKVKVVKQEGAEVYVDEI